MSYLPYFHVFFMALALILIMLAVVIAHSRKADWFKRHRTSAAMAVVCALIAFLAEFIFKAAMNYPHLSSPHAIAGAITLTLLIITPVMGLKIASDPKFRTIHRALGRVTGCAVLLTAVAGVARFIQLLAMK